MRETTFTVFILKNPHLMNLHSSNPFVQGSNVYDFMNGNNRVTNAEIKTQAEIVQIAYSLVVFPVS